MAACEESLESHGDSAELLGFAAPFLTRMGKWEEAESLLRRLEGAGNAAVFHEAAADFHRRRGELDAALKHAEAWVDETPLSMEAKRELLLGAAGQPAMERRLRWSGHRAGARNIRGRMNWKNMVWPIPGCGFGE